VRKGVNRWCFPAAWPIRTCLAVARRAGFDGVELVMGDPAASAQDAPAGPMAHLASPLGYLGIHPYPTPELHPDATPDEVRALGEEVRAHGLAVPSVTTALWVRHPLTAADEAERARGTELYRTALRFAGLLGAETVQLVPGLVQPGSRYDDALAHARDGIAALLPDAERHGVTLAVENVWNQMLQSPLEFRDFVDAWSKVMTLDRFDLD
jgi:hexulose-6-phosphate isomerase